LEDNAKDTAQANEKTPMIEAVTANTTKSKSARQINAGMVVQPAN